MRFFFGRKGHAKEDCHKYLAWHENKGKTISIPLALVCFEAYLIDLFSNSWWLNTGSSIHVILFTWVNM